jgi:hypothetical protein
MTVLKIILPIKVLISIILFGSECCFAQATFNLTGSNLKCSIQENVYLNVQGHFTNINNAQFTNNGQVFITGNISNSATYISGASSNIKFYGTSTQLVTTTATINFQFAEIANTTGVNLATGSNNNVQINGVLTLTDGVLFLNKNTLIINNSTTGGITRTNGFIESEDADSKVQWNIGESTSGNYVFPFPYYNAGNTWYYIPFIFNITAAGTEATTPASINMATYHTLNDNLPFPTGVTNINTPTNSGNMVDRYYIMDFTNYSDKPQATLNFYYDATNPAYELNSLTESSLRAQRWLGTYWGTLEGAYASHYVSVPATSFIYDNIPWALVNEESPLPIELMSFEAYCNGGLIKLLWTTATETNNDYFTIECSLDGINFLPITTVPGSGNSNQIQNYHFVDTLAEGASHFYRLRQTDYDGTISFSDIVFADCNIENDKITIYPNPTSDEIICSIYSTQATEGTLYFYSSIGQMKCSKTIDLEKGLNELHIDVTEWLNGIYYLKYSNKAGNVIAVEKMVIER